MSAAIKRSLQGLSESIEVLDMAVVDAASKPKPDQRELFSGGQKAAASNANASNVEQINSAAFAARLDQAIGRVEDMLKTGRA